MFLCLSLKSIIFLKIKIQRCKLTSRKEFMETMRNSEGERKQEEYLWAAKTQKGPGWAFVVSG